MGGTLSHRGPDEAEDYVDSHLAMAVRRLAIVALENGRQPLLNETGQMILIGNGEIYDHEERRKALQARGHSFYTGSDLEVIIHGYESEGLDVLPGLNGQFAFALWDRHRRRLILARDHFGIAPLFYGDVNGTLIFGSEIKALLQHPLLGAEIDIVGLDQIMTFPGLVSPRTMFCQVRSLEPGHALVADRRGCERIDIGTWITRLRAN